MRDNHEGLPELLKAYEKDNHYYCAVVVTIKGETRAYEIGLSPESYIYYKKIISLQPFDKMPGLKYRYFFVPMVGGNSESNIKRTQVRIELGDKCKQFEVDAPQSLISNLLWFFELKNFESASYLKQISLDLFTL